MFVRAFIGLVGLAVFAQAQTTKYSFSLFATDLTDCDATSKCDAFTKVYCQSKLSDWKLCGQTETKDDNDFPVWEAVFSFDHDPNNRERLRFQVIDDDVFSDDEIATLEFDVNDLLARTQDQKTLITDLNGRGKLGIHMLA